jgi:hypothetical protein
VAARLLHAPPPLAARGFTHGRKKIQATQGVCNGFIHSSFLAGGEEICHLQQKENAQTTMGFNRSLSLDRTILCFSFFLPVRFPLLVADPAVGSRSRPATWGCTDEEESVDEEGDDL